MHYDANTSGIYFDLTSRFGRAKSILLQEILITAMRKSQ